jgi:hypothetical protein
VHAEIPSLHAACGASLLALCAWGGVRGRACVVQQLQLFVVGRCPSTGWTKRSTSYAWAAELCGLTAQLFIMSRRSVACVAPRPALSHHVRSPKVALLADEIANQADADLQAALASNFMDDYSRRAINGAPAPSATEYASSLSVSTDASVRWGAQKTPSPSPEQPRRLNAEPRHPVALRKQYLGSPRTPRGIAASTEEVVKVNGGRLNVQRSVSHSISSSEEAGAELCASCPLPAMDDFSALRDELVHVS